MPAVRSFERNRRANSAIMLVQIQQGLERLDGGSSAYIYAVNDEIVLKSPVTFMPPTEDFSQMAQLCRLLQGH